RHKAALEGDLEAAAGEVSTAMAEWNQVKRPPGALCPADKMPAEKIRDNIRAVANYESFRERCEKFRDSWQQVTDPHGPVATWRQNYQEGPHCEIESLPNRGTIFLAQYTKFRHGMQHCVLKERAKEFQSETLHKPFTMGSIVTEAAG
ncbi:unnamed protein product, partial [Amoebophrya sp. A25]